jgi:cupin 2 domain-containing protein
MNSAQAPIGQKNAALRAVSTASIAMCRQLVLQVSAKAEASCPWPSPCGLPVPERPGTGHSQGKYTMSDNLFGNIPSELPEELIEVLSQSDKVRIERIVSRGHSSPDGFWYDQDLNEFVVLLSGSARLAFENKPDEVHLDPGDFLIIRAHEKHRVVCTAEDQDTIWLAVHYP